MTHPYASGPYASSLSHMGEPLEVPEWATQVLVRPTPCGRARDAAGPYPVAVLPADADLAGGLERLRRAGLVSVVLTLEPHLRPPSVAVEAAFGMLRPFKTHHLYDRRLGPPAYSKHHRYELRRALERVEAREVRLAEHREAWQGLYAELSARKALRGVHAFPAMHHETLSTLPGVRVFGGFLDGRLVSAHVFVTHAGHAMSHLAASTEQGYAAGAAYAVNDAAVAGLTDCEVINFGGGAGSGDDAIDGLVRFKKGFSNSAAPSHLVGSVLDPAAYETLSRDGESGFFPAYRGPLRRERSDAHQG